MGRDRQYSKGGRGTRVYGDLISKAVTDACIIKAELIKKGCQFEPAGDGTLGYKVTLPDGTLMPCASVWQVRDMLVEKGGK